ncbi:uncharacterized protein LOC123950398 [Meles meles]|uniref:uncharacterized protein LOC123950398 n=1 Tax=Meles meles TaxID=9662 RepID=UPI001E69D67B|nr:uncharacterized protein LOC123950398 [Meles meles]
MWTPLGDHYSAKHTHVSLCPGILPPIVVQYGSPVVTFALTECWDPHLILNPDLGNRAKSPPHFLVGLLAAAFTALPEPARPPPGSLPLIALQWARALASDLDWRSVLSRSVPFLVGPEPSLGKLEGFGNKGAELQGFSAGLPWLPARGAARRLLGGKLVTVRRLSAFRGWGECVSGWGGRKGCAPPGTDHALAPPRLRRTAKPPGRCSSSSTSLPQGRFRGSRDCDSQRPPGPKATPPAARAQSRIRKSPEPDPQPHGVQLSLVGSCCRWDHSLRTVLRLFEPNGTIDSAVWPMHLRCAMLCPQHQGHHGLDNLLLHLALVCYGDD